MIDLVTEASSILLDVPEPLRYVKDHVLLGPIQPYLVTASPICMASCYSYPTVECYYLSWGEGF